MQSFMYDTVQTTTDLVAKIQLSYQLAALDPEIGFIFYDGSSTISLGALL
jgi:hypothetical protein